MCDVAPVQGTLFAGRDTSFRESLRVVPMPARPAAPVQKAHSYRRPGPQQDQPRLEFPQPVAAKLVDERAVVCNAPVAVAMHRVVAAVLDASLIAIGVGLLVILTYLAGFRVALDKTTAPYWALAVFAGAMIYRLVWCFADMDSVGMRWVGLRLLNFDGMEPSRGERLQRVIGSCISTSAAGLGLAWALVDEEHLTWHDHMSKTFPSPLASPNRSYARV